MSERAHVEVKCLSTLARYQPEEGRMAITPGETPQELLGRLEIPRKEVNLVFVNKEKAAWDASLVDGDRVAFVPLVSGG